jgi:hypothetical protein
LIGVHFAGGLHRAAVGKKEAARPDDMLKFAIGLLGQADKTVGLDNFRKVNDIAGDDDI